MFLNYFAYLRIFSQCRMVKVVNKHEQWVWDRKKPEKEKEKFEKKGEVPEKQQKVAKKSVQIMQNADQL